MYYMASKFYPNIICLQSGNYYMLPLFSFPSVYLLHCIDSICLILIYNVDETLCFEVPITEVCLVNDPAELLQQGDSHAALICILKTYTETALCSLIFVVTFERF